MKLPHFFKGYSRIGLLNPPIHTKKLNIGVEDGPDAILTPDFLSKFPNYQMSSFTFPPPESIKKEEFMTTLRDSIIDFKQLIENELKPSEIQIVIGGEHTITLPSAMAVMDRHKNLEKLGYIQFDSHGDINLYESSISKNFHGMYVRPLVDHFDVPEIDALVPNKLPIKNVVYFGNLDLDAEEQAFFQKKNIKCFSPEDLRTKKEKNLATFKEFISRFDHLHITFDIDCLDKTIAAATGLPAEQGLLMEDIDEILVSMAAHPSFSFDLVEVNPKKPGARKTIETAQKILDLLLV